MPDLETGKVIAINCGSNKFSQLTRMIEDVGYPVEIITLGQANQFAFEQAHSVIISGGPYLFTDSSAQKQELLDQFEFLNNLERPTLGICLGHQAIALIFKGRIYRDMERRKPEKIRLLAAHFIFEGLEQSPVFDKDHCEGIWPSNRLKVLADSEFYETEVIEVLNRPMLGVQFHPETSGENGKILIRNFLNRADQLHL